MSLAQALVDLEEDHAIRAFNRWAAWRDEYALQEIEARLRWEGATSGRASRLPFLVVLIVEALLFCLFLVVASR